MLGIVGFKEHFPFHSTLGRVIFFYKTCKIQSDLLPRIRCPQCYNLILFRSISNFLCILNLPVEVVVFSGTSVVGCWVSVVCSAIDKNFKHIPYQIILKTLLKVLYNLLFRTDINELHFDI